MAWKVKITMPLGPEVKRVAIEAYPNGSGWFAHSPRNGRTGTIWATAETLEDLLCWARKNRIAAIVI
jgi:hypothetical protein